MTGSLRVDRLEVRAGPAALVRGLSFEAKPGVPFTIIGETGSGKTLVADSIMGTLARELTASGRVVIGDAAYAADDRLGRRALWGRRLAMLPQEPWLALDPVMRTADQVAEVHRFVRGRDRDAANRAAAADLGQVGLSAAGSKFAFQLSGGMAQRVAFAATTATEAPLLLADEPTKGLDAALRDTVGALLLSVSGAGGVLLTITHDIALARALGGRIAVMLEGAIVEEGEATQVLTRPAHVYTRRLLLAEPSSWPRRPLRPPGAPVLRGEGISLALGGAALFDGLDLEARAGEWIAVTGPSGSGKTSLGNVLLGLRAPDRGRVLRSRSLHRLGLQKIYQDPVASFAPQRSLRLSLSDVARRHSLPATVAERALSRLRVPLPLLDRVPSQVSGGELQRIALARVLMLRPAVIFADEPTSRLDPISQQETFELMQEACAETGCAVLLVTHDATLAAAVSDRTITLDRAAA